MSDLTKVVVLGAGVLGGQIAWHSAFKGKTVVVYDVSEHAIGLCRAAHDGYAAIYERELGAQAADIRVTRKRLSYTTDLEIAVTDADLVIEAVPEVPDIKASVYKELSDLLPARTLVATNSSTFLPRDFAAATGRPEKFCALHFANMIWAMNFVEVMAHPGTAPDTLTAITEFAIEIGMLPIPVRKEQNGYVVNTWLVPLLNATQTLITNEIATPADIDRTFMFNGAKFGPAGMMDIVGMKTAYDVLSYWGRQSGDAQMSANADYIKERFLDRGELGVVTGSGYYSYPDPAYQQPGFLAVPDRTAVPEIVSLITSSGDRS
jgi:3-hydroxyacyl-CoA dehydrogenase